MKRTPSIKASFLTHYDLSHHDAVAKVASPNRVNNGLSPVKRRVKPTSVAAAASTQQQAHSKLEDGYHPVKRAYSQASVQSLATHQRTMLKGKGITLTGQWCSSGQLSRN